VVLLLLEVVLPVVLVAIIGAVIVLERRTRRSRGALWAATTHGLPEGGFAVVLQCDGQPTQLVARIPPGLPHEQFSERLAEAQAEAEADAAALNASVVRRSRA